MHIRKGEISIPTWGGVLIRIEVLNPSSPHLGANISGHLFSLLIQTPNSYGIVESPKPLSVGHIQTFFMLHRLICSPHVAHG